MKKTAVLFSVLCAGALLLTGCGKKKNTVHSIDDLKGKTIGVQLGTTGDTMAEGFSEAIVEKYNKYSDAVDSLIQGKIDAVIIDRDTAKVFLDDNANEVEILKNSFAEESYAIAVNLENKALLDELNGALKKLSLNGDIRDIKDNYEGVNAGSKRYQSPEGVDRSKGKLTMATNSDFPPYEYKSDSGEVIGFDVDMMNAVCDELGYELVIQDIAFDAIIPAVKGGKADVGVAGISVNPEREKEVAFTNTYVTTHLVVMVRKD